MTNLARILLAENSEKRKTQNIIKVEKILKGSLDSVLSPSPSVKIQIMRENLLEVQRQNIAGGCQQTFENKKFVDITLQCFAFYLIICKQPKNSSYLLIWLLLSHTWGHHWDMSGQRICPVVVVVWRVSSSLIHALLNSRGLPLSTMRSGKEDKHC